MANLNKVLLMGNLTRDPELRYLQSGSAVCDFGVAVNRRWRSQAGEQKEEVCFVDVTFFGRTAEVISEYMKKGRPIFIEGRLKLDTWTNKEGQKRSKLHVVGERMQFLDSRGGQGGGSRQSSSSRPQRGASSDADDGFDIDDDSIPF
jgi:single-strand DNA-binding protein